MSEWTRKHWFVGVWNSDGETWKAEVFASCTRPSRENHGKYAFVFGSFETKLKAKRFEGRYNFAG